MKVSNILKTKGHDIITAQPHRTLHEIAHILAEKGIGAVVITSADGGLMGIISERDLVRVLARNGAAALNDAVSRHMTPKVVTATRETSIDHLAEQMTAGRLRHMPIVESGRLLGLVSIGDVVKWRVEEIESEHKAMREYIANA